MVEIEIFEVDAHKSGSRCGDDAVHEALAVVRSDVWCRVACS
jgi:hypothetical protein